MANEIQCPSCKSRIPLNEALSSQIRDEIQREERKKVQALELELKRKSEEALRAREVQIRADLSQAQKVEFESLKQTLQDRERLLEETRKNELEVRRKAAELADKARDFELKLQREVDQARVRLEEEIAKRVTDEHRFKAAEKDQQLESMRAQIEELKRRAEQGSQQAQGEAVEIDFEALLRTAFPQDHIEPVGKGVRGGDILHRIVAPNGKVAGTLVWELKNTKHFSDGWIQKLKDDIQSAGADLGVLVTQCLPKGLTQVGLYEGICVTGFSCALGVGQILRVKLLALAQSRSALVGQGEKTQILYNYLTGVSFRQKVEAMAGALEALRESLYKEKTAMQKIWSTREQQIERVMLNIASLYGDVQGIVGSALGPVSSFELSQASLSDRGSQQASLLDS